MKINYYICQQLTLKFIFIKKISIFAASLLFVAAAVTGYKAWQNSHLTPEEALMKANIEALACEETGEGWPWCGLPWELCLDNDGGSGGSGGSGGNGGGWPPAFNEKIVRDKEYTERVHHGMADELRYDELITTTIRETTCIGVGYIECTSGKEVLGNRSERVSCIHHVW